nr:hypothetical protein B0A51_02045 [Rachicladosporium sp. CCFEE 5018]
MGFLDIIKILFFPALIAASLYGLFGYIIIPLARQHRNRYDQYLPINAIQSTSTTLRDRLADLVIRIATRGRRRNVADGREESDDNLFGDEEGESMVGFDVERRERNVRGGRVEVIGSDRRLSRELEEGFKDDSSEEGGEEGRGRERGRG